VNWFTILLIIGAVAALGGFGYLCYLVWKEISATLNEIQKTKEPIEHLVEEIHSLQPMVESLANNANQQAMEIREIIEDSKSAAKEVSTMIGAINALRSPQLQLAVRQGKTWIEEMRMNPVTRNVKRFLRKFAAKAHNSLK
jgi:FtsZ-binding cell division protein ZapB